MRADDFLARATDLPVATLAAVLGGGGLVVVAPHPDDESLGCGGMIAEACAGGVPTRLVVVSDGAGSHPRSQRFAAPRLRDLREAETREAVAGLGLDPSTIRFLRLPDRSVPTVGPDADAAGLAVVAAAREVEAGVVLVSWRHDPHCDHLASAEIVFAKRAMLAPARILQYPIWGWALPPGQEVGPAPRGCRIDVSRHAAAKAAAIAAHRSQTTDLVDDDPTGFRLTSEMIANFSGPYEILLEEVPA